MDDPDVRLQPWKLLSEQKVFETPWFSIQKQELEMPSGATPTFYIHDTHDSVICVCVTDDKKVLIEKQYRPAVKKISIDYPAGRLEGDDKDTETAMLRELQEETGYTPKSFKKLAVIDKDPSFSTTKMHIFLAQGVLVGQNSPEITEAIKTEFVTAKQLLEMIRVGTMNCTFCVSATFFAFTELGWLNAQLD